LPLVAGLLQWWGSGKGRVRTPIDWRVLDSVGVVVQPAQERLGVAPGTRRDTKRDVTSLELIKRPVGCHDAFETRR